MDLYIIQKPFYRKSLPADIKTLNISIDDAPYQITIHGNSGSGADNEDDAVITVNLVGFSPRTIEEF